MFIQHPFSLKKKQNPSSKINVQNQTKLISPKIQNLKNDFTELKRMELP